MPTKPSTTHLGVRLTLAERRTIARAARIQKVTLSTLVRVAALRAAEEAIYDEKNGVDVGVREFVRGSADDALKHANAVVRQVKARRAAQVPA